MLSGYEIAPAGLAVEVAGLINALAGGGTLMSFPALIAPGVMGVAANITNTVVLCPGYPGGAMYRERISGAIGGVALKYQ